MNAPARPRRTQDERSAETRRKLLDATIDCLVEHGYAGMTTSRVVRRAGVTRGAQAHHFSTKAALVTAAVHHLAARRTEQAIQRMSQLVESTDPIGDVLDLVWELHQGPVFTATVELWLVARTDPELRRQIVAVEPAATGSMIGIAQALLPDRATQQELLNYFYTVMDTVRGVLVGGFAARDERQLAARWRRAKAELRVLAEAVLDRARVSVDDLLRQVSARS
ncbi:regulatory protein, tetR family [Amycolatopsis arida]|uniref:Regulatory protein, tetR family n=1 Tax=Amycolatopsis arida TaxID=587909 RepID=A0A1I5SDM2_9PSEU|nr:TetR/AcrR family transcriptional regulator [Amycolatopsis arida]TDX96510.1 regulatory TetR family protein [Amycolatopsis arida]SFP68825.1 regulatory protein, tetR family [Amycolatopsis arida]